MSRMNRPTPFHFVECVGEDAELQIVLIDDRAALPVIRGSRCRSRF